MDIMNFFLGLAVGLATNLFSWWLLFHGIVPKMRFSEFISKIDDDDIGHDKSGYSYKIKFENPGRRAIIDLEVMARIRIKGLRVNKELWHTFLVPLNPDGSLYFRIPKLMPIGSEKRAGAKKQLHSGRPISRFFINSAVEHIDRPPFPREIRKKAKLGTLKLEDLLGLGTRATLEVEAFGYDEFSGTRKLFVSKLYISKDVKVGDYEANSLRIVPATNSKPRKPRKSPSWSARPLSAPKKV